MAVQLILGPAGSGKTKLAIQRLRQFDLLSWSSEVRFIVPTSEQREQLQNHLLSDEAIPGFLGSPVCTFYDFASDIIAEAGLRTKLISDVQKRLTLADALATTRLSYFRSASASIGFVEAVGQIIGELKISMIDPRELQQAAMSSQAQMPPESLAKIRELLDLYQKYQQDILIGRKVHDREGVMWRALEILRDRKLLSRYRMFILDGFDQFTGVQKEFLRLISDQASEVLVTLTYEEGRREVFESVEPAVEFVRSLGGVEELRLDRKSAPSNSLEVLEERLFSPRPGSTDCDDTITMLAGGTPRMEAEMVAAEIVRTANAGTPYDDIAVVARGLEDCYPRLSDALRRHGIPFREFDRPAMNTALAKFAAASVEACTQGWQRDHVIAVLKSPFTGLDLALACTTEIRGRQLGLISGRESWLDRWGEEDDTYDYRVRALTPIAHLNDELSSVESAEEFVAVMKRFIAALAWRTEDEELLKEDAAASRAVLSVLKDLARTEELVGRKISGNELRELFLQGLASAKYRPDGSNDAGVALLKAESIGGQRYEVVFLVGLLEKVFPRQVREDPFFRDSERRKLNEALGGRFLERLPGQSRERLLFYSAATAARKRLYLTYPLSDSAASDSLPSFYLDEVRKLFTPGSIPTSTRDVGEVVMPPWEAQTNRGKLEGLVYGLASGSFDGEPLAECYNSLQDVTPIAGALRAASDFEAVLTDEEILAHTASSRRMFTATELEDYAACPFKHFCSRVLGLEKVEDEVTPLNRGIILHTTLHNLFEGLKSEYGESFWLRDVDQERLADTASQLLDQAIDQDAMILNLPGYLRELERKSLTEALVRFLKKETERVVQSFVPTYFELEFGSRPKEGRDRDPESTERPLVVNRNDRFVQICGKIDRTDIDPETRQCIAIDYKLSSAVPLKDLEAGLKMQAPLYALALKKLFNLEPVAALYRGIFKCDSDGYKVGEKLTAEDFEKRLESCEERVIEIADRIAAAEISVLPAEHACDYCSLDSICRIDQWKRLQIRADLKEGADNGRD